MYYWQHDATVVPPVAMSELCHLSAIQEVENKMRNTLNEIYFGKTRDIVNSLRSVNPLPDQAKIRMLQGDLAAVLNKRAQIN